LSTARAEIILKCLPLAVAGPKNRAIDARMTIPGIKNPAIDIPMTVPGVPGPLIDFPSGLPGPPAPLIMPTPGIRFLRFAPARGNGDSRLLHTVGDDGGHDAETGRVASEEAARPVDLRVS
jgi:hypothetical protein